MNRFSQNQEREKEIYQQIHTSSMRDGKIWEIVYFYDYDNYE